MLVHKRKSGAGVEAMITPEPQPILTPNAYRIIPGHANITLKPSNLDRIKVNLIFDPLRKEQELQSQAGSMTPHTVTLTDLPRRDRSNLLASSKICLTEQER